MMVAPAASTCSSRETSVDTKSAGKRSRVDATAIGGSISGGSSKLVCREDLRVKAAARPKVKKPLPDEHTEEVQMRPEPRKSAALSADDTNTLSVLKTMMAQELEQQCSPPAGDRLRWGSSIIHMVHAQLIET
jgi:hypothetical protein